MVRLDQPGLDNKVRQTLCCLQVRNSDETPEMWCDRIHAPFKKILEENLSFFSKNEYIQMYDWSYEDGKKVTTGPLIHSTNYIYCTVCDSLVYIPDNWNFCLTHSASASNHLKRCIAGADECAKMEEFLHVIARKEFSIWKAKREILSYEAEIRRNLLELSPQFQSLSHSEKDELASVNYVINDISYETFRASMAGPDPAHHNYITMTQDNYTTMAEPDIAQHDYTNLGTLSAYFKSMRKSADL
jgi:hypothetical protein